MGNQQNLSPRIAERVFEAMFPSCFGAIAQLGEHLPCTQRVLGSSPSGSTTFLRDGQTFIRDKKGDNSCNAEKSN